jgi:DNA-binding transcriptional LysR family regulator
MPKLHNWLINPARIAKMDTTRTTSPAAMPFDWQLVQTFLAVLDTGSLLGAAKRLRHSQSTLGRQVAALEQQLGLTLFERTGRGLTPTQAAHELADAARGMQAAALAMQAAVSREAHALTGTVCLSASSPVAYGLLPPLLADMAQALPGITVDVVATNAVSNLLQREADIALRMVEPLQQTTVARRVGTVRLGCYAHERYVSAHPPLRGAADLPQHKLIGDRLSGEILRGFAALGFVLPEQNVVFRSDDFLAQWGAIQAGLGVGFVSDYLAATNPQVKHLLPDLPIPGIPMWLVAHREVRTNARVKAVFDWLAQALTARLV